MDADTQIVLFSAEQERELRMVLVGKTGAGKSSTGNTILGRKVFKSTMSPSSVTSECEKGTVIFDGQIVAVVDTPGLYDNKLPEAQVRREIGKCVSFSAPGPHVFLVVIEPKRFTEEEQNTVKLIKMMFGEAAAHYTMVLFTHGDDLEEEEVSIEDFIKENKNLTDFIRQCGGRYHVFNNRNKDPSQVKELLEKINSMVQRNGGRCYTNEMFREAERALLEEIKRLLRENVAMRLEEARSRAERENDFLRALLTTSGACFGALAGLVVAGPVGCVLGGAAGAAYMAKKTKACVIQ